MNIIVCVDDDNGMMFNNRRQSRDRVVIEDIVNTVKNNTLYVDKYSAPLFADKSCSIIADDDFLSKAGINAYCFVENRHISEFYDKIISITIYRWNRKYPSDFGLDIEPKSNMILTSSTEMVGYSHKIITKEIYIK